MARGGAPLPRRALAAAAEGLGFGGRNGGNGSSGSLRPTGPWEAGPPAAFIVDCVLVFFTPPPSSHPFIANTCERSCYPAVGGGAPRNPRPRLLGPTPIPSGPPTRREIPVGRRIASHQAHRASGRAGARARPPGRGRRPRASLRPPHSARCLIPARRRARVLGAFQHCCLYIVPFHGPTWLCRRPLAAYGFGFGAAHDCALCALMMQPGGRARARDGGSRAPRSLVPQPGRREPLPSPHCGAAAAM
ncbi:MAG: hypothetical protein J3K34DRAFT_419793 [Monoraphidium minutum]|nr:MAG: hypothetical protein J3K34DRAFT_419793 [Monoraphidium minutum]